ncbi:MAG TPA: DUF934 domain-containing protein [Polyangiales bacterium]
MRIIKDRKLVDDSFVHVADGEELPTYGDLIVSLDRYRELRAALHKRPGKVGVRLRSNQEAKLVADVAPELAVIAIEFPGFKDGRGYSTARLLRDRYGYKGEVRAVGDVLRDQLFYMERCGFNAFELKAGKDMEGAVNAFREYSVTYQAAADDPRPLFRRREQP